MAKSAENANGRGEDDDGDHGRRLPIHGSRLALIDVSNSSKKQKTVQPSSKKNTKVLNWQERRKLEWDRKQREEDERRTLASIEAPISESDVGFKLLKQMVYTPGSALGKEGSGRAGPVGIEIRLSRAGIGREDPQWRSKNVVINFLKAKAALDQLEDKDVLRVVKNEGKEGEQEEEEAEEIMEEYATQEELLSCCLGADEDDH